MEKKNELESQVQTLSDRIKDLRKYIDEQVIPRLNRLDRKVNRAYFDTLQRDYDKESIRY